MQEAWVVAVDMGYGHQRAAHPLRHLSPTGKVIIANNYEGISRKDRAIWQSSRHFYEFFSRSKNLPIVGDFLFDLLIDRMQRIQPFYPARDLTRPNFQLITTYRTVRGGWGEQLVRLLNQKNTPLITTFPAVAFMAEEHGFKEDIYCVICDSDIARAWAPLNPRKSRIKYLTPCRRATARLGLYGVKNENIFLTGFPLPEENLGTSKLGVLKADLSERIVNLDPEKKYREKYSGTFKQFFKDSKLNEVHHHPLTLSFAVGGAGAQRTIAKDLLRSLHGALLDQKINLNLVAGTRNDVYLYFQKLLSESHLTKLVGKNIKIIFALNKEEYFADFNKSLRTTDVLWTKPSELVFYSALGIPIIIAPPLGSQEVFNKTWLKTVGAGISQEDPRYANEWLFDWVNSGWLAEAAMGGFLDGRQFGVENMMDVIFRGARKTSRDYQLI